MGTLKLILVAVILTLLLTGCKDSKDDWADFNVTCAGLGYSTKSLKLERTYLFGVVPMSTTTAATCSLPPLDVTETNAPITKSSK